MTSSRKTTRNTANDFKLMFIGESGVGKSSILQRASDNMFTPSFMPTIGIDFRRKTVFLDEDTEVHLQLWDTAGQERFRTITTAYYRGAEAFALVYDVTDIKSFERVAYWVEMARHHTNNRPIPFVLVANKVDKIRFRVVDSESGRELARKFEMAYFEMSAKTGEGVEEPLIHLARQVRFNRRKAAAHKKRVNTDTDSDIDTESETDDREVELNKKKEPRDRGCCVVA